MTVIDVVTCNLCGDEHPVVCEHEDKQCEHCGLVFSSVQDRVDHEEDCA